MYVQFDSKKEFLFWSYQKSLSNDWFLYGNNENMDLASKGSHLILKKHKTNVKYGNMNVKFVKSLSLLYSRTYV